MTALLQVNKYTLQGESLGLEGNSAAYFWLGQQGKKLPATNNSDHGWISLLTSLPGPYHTPGVPGNTGPSTISIQIGEQETGKTQVSLPSVNQEQAGPHQIPMISLSE